MATASALPTDQKVDFALSLLLARQGLSPAQVHDLVVKMQAARNELAIRQLAYVPSVSATSAGGILADMEAMDAFRE